MALDFFNKSKQENSADAPENVEKKNATSSAVVILYLQKNEETDAYEQLRDEEEYDSFAVAKAAINQKKYRYARPVPSDATQSRIEKAWNEMQEEVKRDEKKAAASAKPEEATVSAKIPVVPKVEQSQPTITEKPDVKENKEETSQKVVATEDVHVDEIISEKNSEQEKAYTQEGKDSIPESPPFSHESISEKAIADNEATREPIAKETTINSEPTQATSKPDKPSTDKKAEEDDSSLIRIGYRVSDRRGGADSKCCKVKKAQVLEILAYQKKILIYRGKESDFKGQIQDKFMSEVRTLNPFKGEKDFEKSISVSFQDAPEAPEKPSRYSEQTGSSTSTHVATQEKPSKYASAQQPANTNSFDKGATQKKNQDGDNRGFVGFPRNDYPQRPDGRANGFSTGYSSEYGYSGSPSPIQRTNNQDITQMFDRLMRRIDSIENKIQQLSSTTTTSEGRVLAKVENLGQYCNAAISPLATTDQLNRKLRSVEDNVVDAVETLSGNVKDTVPALEIIQGKLSTVEEILSKKGVTIQREANPTSTDEKEIVNAQRLINRLVDGVISMALEYARNREAIDNSEIVCAQIRSESTEKERAAFANGQMEAYKQILSKFADIDSFLEDESNNVIAAVMKNAGLRVDDELRKGEVVTISDDTYMSKVKGYESAGQYKVILSAYYLCNDLVQIATVDKISD